MVGAASTTSSTCRAQGQLKGGVWGITLVNKDTPLQCSEIEVQHGGRPNIQNNAL